MILAFDSYYENRRAKTVCLSFENWTDDKPFDIHTEYKDDVADYTPGEFYKRELPCILDLLNTLPYKEISCIVVDGFVYLDDDFKPGLGAKLYNALENKIPVIGVAKTNFATLFQLKKEIHRGDSKRPLYITSIGVNSEEAAGWIQYMHGEFRIPTLLSKLDQITKEK